MRIRVGRPNTFVGATYAGFCNSKQTVAQHTFTLSIGSRACSSAAAVARPTGPPPITAASSIYLDGRLACLSILSRKHRKTRCIVALASASEACTVDFLRHPDFSQVKMFFECHVPA